MSKKTRIPLLFIAADISVFSETNAYSQTNKPITPCLYYNYVIFMLLILCLDVIP